MCTDEQHSQKMAVLNRIEQHLIALKPRPFIDQFVSVSTLQGFFLDYKNRKYVYVNAEDPITFNLVNLGSVSVPANIWTQFSYQEGLQIFSIGNATPIGVLVRATDDIIGQ